MPVSQYPYNAFISPPDQTQAACDGLPTSPLAMRTKPRPPPQPKQNLPANYDEVKRRFIRQNRELAKNNSTQSLRIRSLEIEVSRLLQTNLELREELLRARNSEHDARRQSTTDGVRGFKEEMMAKLRELSGIVEGIEEDKQQRVDESQEREERRMSVLSQMEFRERQPLAELMRDCQMPTIDEDKIHQRRTLEAAEIKAIRLSDGSSNGSPDLGPPPVARFECQEPIKFDTRNVAESQEIESPAESEPELEKKSQDEDLPASMSVNLETRRKRKDSQPKLELRRHSILPPPSPSTSEAEVTAPTLRTGAKRKLADRDLDKPTNAPSKTDFTFSRKVALEPEKNAVEMSIESEEKPETVEIQAPAPPSARRVLGDKSVNMSPRKAVASTDKPLCDDVKKPSQPKFGAAKERTTSRRSRMSAIPPQQQESEINVASIELPASQQQPAAPAAPAVPQEPSLHTPAASDLFSPTPEYSTGPTNRSGTPPPTGPNSATIEAARPSRRARSAVNYAEPSLGAKMRRQEKGMMDAVTGLQHHRLAMSGSSERKSRGASVGSTVKTEPQDEDAWKNLPTASEAAARARAASPLQSKGGSVDGMTVDSIAPSKIDRNGGGAVSSEVKLNPPAARQRVRSSTTQDKEKDRNVRTSDGLDDAARKLHELDLYDFKDLSSSSPADQQQQQSHIPSAAKTSTAAPPRSHRRHSSVPKETMKSSAAGPVASAGPSETERVKTSSNTTASSSGRTSAASRRRSMMT
jgi:hypothetical protein